MILDDILVNFDPERSAAACDALAELAQHHQVIYLTCHPATVDQLVAAAPNARVIPLPASDVGSSATHAAGAS